MEGKIGVIWQGGVIRNRQTIYCRVLTSVPNLLHSLEASGVKRAEFNKMITGVASSKFMPCTLFVKGYRFGRVYSVLKGEGLCSDYRRAEMV